MRRPKVAVIGGGAAGMMAAVAAAEAGADVCLLEKNEKLGKKLFITGKGRCNLTNGCDRVTFFDNCVSNPKFLYSAYAGFDNRAVMDFFEKAGCPLKEERGNRIFPLSDHSYDVTDALAGQLRKYHVKVLFCAQVQKIVTTAMPAGDNESDLTFAGKVTGVALDDGRFIDADRVIVSTGGLSYPSTGSSGDGYRFAMETGHQITPPCPALVSFRTAQEWCASLAGLTLKNVSVRLMKGKRKLFDGFGEMLFTHQGVSGPLILSASSFYAHDRDEGECRLYINLKPALDMQKLDARLIRDFEENRNKQFKNALSGLFPSSLIPVMVSLSGIDPEKKACNISKSERTAFASLIKDLPLDITGTGGYDEAVITMGGVSVKDIVPSTMESKKIRGLYFAGEVLDVDALTGGFNLQIAWSTGHLAGVSAAACGK